MPNVFSYSPEVQKISPEVSVRYSVVGQAIAKTVESLTAQLAVGAHPHIANMAISAFIPSEPQGPIAETPAVAAPPVSADGSTSIFNPDSVSVASATSTSESIAKDESSITSELAELSANAASARRKIISLLGGN